MKTFISSTLMLFFFTVGCQSQNPKVDRVVVNCDKSVEIYTDSIGRRVQQIIDKYATATLEDSLINSLSIGLYINRVSYLNHYGELEKGKNNKPNNETIYEIASVTKTFTGTLAAMAVLDDKMNVEEDIRKYLPAAFSNLQFQGKPIKIKHLLTHTSGLPVDNKGYKEIPTDLSEAEFAEAYYQVEINQTKEMFLGYLAEIELVRLPGSQFEYSNYGTNLMGYILERIYNKPFQELVQEKIIDEIGLTKTDFILPERSKKHLANGYKLGKPMPELPLAYTLWGAEGALKSTVPDMLKYISYQLANTKVVKESHRKLYEIDKDYCIGYYWWIIENNNHDLHFRHDGGALSTKNVLLIYPGSKIGISIFTNESAIQVNQKLSDLAHHIYEELSQ